MSDRPYVPWVRYWTPVGVSPETDADGFLREPYYQSEYSGTRTRVANAAARTLAELAPTPCVVLLGEPGAGKSTELAHLDEPGAVRVDLGAVGGEVGFAGALAGHPAVQAWKADGRPLTLLVDAYDEALLRVEAAAALLRAALTEGLPDAPDDRQRRAAALRLRVTSRGGVWPDSVTGAFQTLWGLGGVGVYTLAPLRRQDVALAAKTLGGRPGFVEAVVEAEAGSWASLPLSLLWLLRLYDRDGTLPDTRRELFERGARILCEEANPSRIEAGRYGVLDPDRRLALAGRLAALMRFGDRAALSLRGHDDHPEGALAVPEAEGPERSPSGASFTVGPEALRDLVQHTALFRAAGPGVYRWTQEATADFLAAWYLDHRGVQTPQALSLVTDPDDGHVVPQLMDVGAWVAAFDSGVFLVLAEREPNVALGADPASLPAEVRRLGVDRYLAEIGAGRLDTFTDPTPRSARAFRHPSLAGQLAGWIGDPNADPEARSEAVRIASQNRLDGLAPQLFDHALYPAAPPQLRVTCVYALRWLADLSVLGRLRPLALDPAPGEDAERLRAAVRFVLWPGGMSFADLVASAALTPDDESDSMTERLFGDRVFGGDPVSDADVADALDWIAAGRAAEVPALARGALVAAAERAGVPAVGRRLGPLLVRIATREDEFAALRAEEHHVRKALGEGKGERPDFLATLVGALAGAERETAVFVVSSAFWPVRYCDVRWLVGHLLAAADEPRREVCYRLLDTLSTPPDSATLDEVARVIRAAAPKSPHLQAIVRERYDAWSLDEEWVQKVRAGWRRWERPAAPPLTPPIPERIDAALAEPVLDRWRQVCHTLTLRPDSNTHRDFGDLEADVTALSGWAVLNEERRDRVVEAALAYVAATAPDESDWATSEGEKRVWSWRVLDGVRALTLLRARGVLVPDAVWRAWAPALLLRTEGGSVKEADAHRALVARAAQADPEAFRRHFTRALAVPNSQLGALARAVAPLGDAALDAALLGAVRDGHVDTYAAHEVLQGLLERGTPGATDEVVRLVNEADGPHLAATWALLHLQTDPVGGWAAHGDRVLTDDVFARALLAHVADRSRGAALPAETPVEALVALERRLHALYPPADDPPRPKGVYSPTTEDHVRDLRGGFAAALAAKGADEAVAAVEALTDVLSARTVRYQAKRARRRRREASHRALAPADLLALIERADARLVRSADELLAVTVEALGSFEDWLRAGEAPRVFDLWNHVPRAEALRLAAAIARAEAPASPLADEIDRLGTSRKNPSFSFPKSEDALADLGLRFLRERLGPRGVIVAREAEVQRGHATDLYVAVPGADDGRAAVVVVEVKASWHPHLYGALGDQLAGGYLDGVTRRHGVYLVGWYGPDGWYQPAPGTLHPKARSARKGGRAQVASELEARAGRATSENRRVVALVVDASLPPSRASA